MGGFVVWTATKGCVIFFNGACLIAQPVETYSQLKMRFGIIWF